MNEEKTDNKGLSFYGTFVRIYMVLNIAAFVILLLTTEWSVLANDEGDGFFAGFCFMVIGIAIHGIGPALTFKRRGNTRLLYLFPLAVMLVGFAVLPFESLALCFAIGGFLIMPLGFPLFICFSHTSSIYSGILDSIWFMSVTPAVIYALVIFATTLFMRRKQQSINARMKQ